MIHQFPTTGSVVFSPRCGRDAPAPAHGPGRIDGLLHTRPRHGGRFYGAGMDVSLARVVPPDARRVRGHGTGPARRPTIPTSRTSRSRASTSSIRKCWGTALRSCRVSQTSPGGCASSAYAPRTGTGLCSARNSEPPAAEQRHELDLQHAACHQI
jgi:hypothetical protein